MTWLLVIAVLVSVLTAWAGVEYVREILRTGEAQANALVEQVIEERSE